MSSISTTTRVRAADLAAGAQVEQFVVARLAAARKVEQFVVARLRGEPQPTEHQPASRISSRMPPSALLTCINTEPAAGRRGGLLGALHGNGAAAVISGSVEHAFGRVMMW
ncbi:hypothetical protein ACF0H2_05200 [Serratia marcescens]